jgi:flavin-binding protein dodecin
MAKKTVRGEKHIPQGQKMKHSDAFDEALDNALQNADAEWGGGTTVATVRYVAVVETQSPGNIHEYRVFLDPTP